MGDVICLIQSLLLGNNSPITTYLHFWIRAVSKCDLTHLTKLQLWDRNRRPGASLFQQDDRAASPPVN